MTLEHLDGSLSPILLPQLRPRPVLESEGPDFIRGKMSLPSSHIEGGSAGMTRGPWETHLSDCDLRSGPELSTTLWTWSGTGCLGLGEGKESGIVRAAFN